MPKGWVDPPGEVSFFCQPSGGQVERYIWRYFGNHRPGPVTFRLPEGREFRADILDTWEMSITPVAGTFCDSATIALPTKPYRALRLLKTS